MLLQTPFNPKDWSSSIPSWLLAFGFLAMVGVYVAKQLGLVAGKAADRAIEITSGNKPPEYWEKRFDDLREQMVEDRREQLTVMRELTRAVNELTNVILRGKL